MILGRSRVLIKSGMSSHIMECLGTIYHVLWLMTRVAQKGNHLTREIALQARPGKPFALPSLGTPSPKSTPPHLNHPTLIPPTHTNVFSGQSEEPSLPTSYSLASLIPGPRAPKQPDSPGHSPRCSTPRRRRECPIIIPDVFPIIAHQGQSRCRDARCSHGRGQLNGRRWGENPTGCSCRSSR